MKRLVTALAGVGLMLALTPPAVAPAASNNATTLMPLNDGTQLETFARLDCHPRKRQLRLHRRRRPQDRRRRDRIPERPVVAAKHRRSAPTDRTAYLDVHATAQYDRVMKDGGPTKSPRSTWARARRRSTRPPAGSTRPTGTPASRVPTSTSSLHAHPGGLQRGQHHLTEHLRAGQLLLSRRVCDGLAPQRRQRDSRKVITARTRR